MGTLNISVAMCTYNGERFLREQLQSMANQTLLPLEVVICDDCSTDSTVKILKEFALSAPFYVRVVENEKNIGSTERGITGNFEKAIGLCQGELIFLCDQDDSWSPDKLSRLSNILECNPEFGGAFSEARLMDQQSSPTGRLLSEITGFNAKEQKILNKGRALRVLLGMNKVYGCTLMFRASLRDRLLPVPPNWWFDAWIACMASTHSRLAFVSEPLMSYRVHQSQFFGATPPSLSERVKQAKRSAKEYLEEAQPQLEEFRERLVMQNDPSLQPAIEYLSGRLELLKLRAALPSNRLLRMGKIVTETVNYHKYFNGWRSIIKDLIL